MLRQEPATEKEIEAIKDHFEKRGYGRISDFTARAQTDLLRYMRENTNGEKIR